MPHPARIRPLDTLAPALAALAVGLPALISLIVPLPAVDLAYQVRAGSEILRTGALPTADTWTFTIAGTPWTDQQWLAQVVFAAVHGAGGWELLAVLRAALVAGVAGLLLFAGWLRGAGIGTSAVLSLLAFMLAAPALALRPQLLGIALFAGLLVLLVARERRPRVLLAAPLLVAAWANIHGSFVLAPIVLGWALLDDVVRGRSWRLSAAVLAAGCLATLANPYGAGVWTYAAGIGTSPVITQSVSEWQRTTPFTVPGLLFYLSVAAVAVLAVAVRRRSRLRWPDVLWLASLVLLGVWAIRGVAWWPAGALPVVAGLLGDPRRSRADPGVLPGRAPRRGPAVLVIGVLALAIAAALPWARPADPLSGRQGLLAYAPSGLAQALRTNAAAGARAFVPQAWGSWFEWADPGVRYFADARFELYPAAVWADLLVISDGGAAAASALDRYQVDLVVLPTGWTGPGPGWSVVYRDADGVLLQRATP